MKRIILILLLFILALPVFSGENEYYLCEKYRKEITKAINSQVPILKKELAELFNQFKEEQKLSIIKNDDEYTSIEDEIVMHLYFDLIDITEKYAGEKKLYNSIYGSDDIGELHRTLKPYLKGNKINISKINSLFNYIKREHRKLKVILQNFEEP